MNEVSRRSMLLGLLGLACTSAEQSRPIGSPPTPVPSASQVPTAAWKSFAPVPTQRSEVGAAAIGNRVYVVGGLARDARGDYTTDVVEMYDVTSSQWQTRRPLPQPIHHPAVTNRGDELWVIGGYTGNWTSLDTTYVYDHSADSWREGPRLLTARGALGAAVVDGMMFAVGGYTNTNVANVEALDPAATSWINRKPLSTGRDHMAVIAFNGVVYAIGGRQDNRGNLNLVEAYDRSNDTWRTMAPLPTARSGIAAAVLNNRIHVFGGEGDAIHPEHEAYTPATNAWEKLAPMPTPRHGHGAVTVGTQMLTLAGGIVPGYSVSGANEAFGVG